MYLITLLNFPPPVDFVVSFFLLLLLLLHHQRLVRVHFVESGLKKIAVLHVTPVVECDVVQQLNITLANQSPTDHQSFTFLNPFLTI